MQILLIGNKETSQDPEQYYRDYKAFLDKAISVSETDAEVCFTLFDDLVISVGDEEFSIYDSRSQKDISESQLILIRGKGFRNLFDVVKTISSYAHFKNVPVINDYHAFRDSSKLTQAVQFFEQGLPVAKSVYVTPAVLQEKQALGFVFPCIMKATFGSHGNDNHMVKNMSEAQDIAQRNPGKAFVLQRFIPNNNDYRILIVGDEVLVIDRQAVEGSHLNNTSQGGRALLLEASQIPAEIIEDSRKIMRYLDMTVSGVDVLADKETGAFFFLEVNSQPQLMSGAFIDEKAVIVGRYLKQLLDRSV